MSIELTKNGVPRKKNGRWKNGAVPNPEGRAPWSWGEILRSMADSPDPKGKLNKIAAAEAFYKQCRKGNIVALKEFGDRMDGKVTQPVDAHITGDITVVSKVPQSGKINL